MSAEVLFSYHNRDYQTTTINRFTIYFHEPPFWCKAGEWKVQPMLLDHNLVILTLAYLSVHFTFLKKGQLRINLTTKIQHAYTELHCSLVSIVYHRTFEVGMQLRI